MSPSTVRKSLALTLVVGLATTSPVAAESWQKSAPTSGNGTPGAAVYAGSAIACSAGGLILRAAHVWNQEGRELSDEEAHAAVAGCFFPPLLLLNLLNKDNGSN